MRRFGLIGKTLKHSFSQNYFREKFQKEGIGDCLYENYELSGVEDLPALLEKFPDLQGLNITIPFKEAILPFLDQKNAVVEATGACNCLRVVEGKLLGFNTDVAGFRGSLEPCLQPHHTHALVLGSGGASKAVQYALKDLGIAYRVVSRRPGTGELGYEDIDDVILEEYTLVINTTPLGMFPNVDDDPPLPYQFISQRHLLFDLVYNPPKTKFLQQGEKQGARIVNGYEMLVLQAEESWRIWNETL